MRSWTGRLATKARKGRRETDGFLQDQSGATYVLVATTLTVLVGMAGLGFDATIWYKDRRDVQSVADMSVLAGVHAKLIGADLDTITQEVKDQAARNGFVHDTDGTITVNSPPDFGTHKDDPEYVEVIVDMPRRLNFAAMFLEGDTINISARAVSGLLSGGDNCVLALSQTETRAIRFAGTADVDSACGIASNSSDSQAIYINGSASVTVGSAQAYGQIHDQHGNMVVGDPNQVLAVRLDDPYEGTEIPAVTAADCDFTEQHYDETHSPLQEGVYCGGMHISGDVTLEPGVYIVFGTNAGKRDLVINGGADVDANGPVTFILTSDNDNKIGKVTINGNATVDLDAPDADGHDDGPYQDKYGGMLIVQDPDANPNLKNKFNGGAAMDLSGAVYLPGTETELSGGSDTAPGCLQIVTRTVDFVGDSGFGNTPEACDTQGVADITQKRVRLFE